MSFLDTLLSAAVGQIRTAPTVTAGQSVIASPGQLVPVDPTGGSASVSAPSGPSFGTFFGVADVTAQSGAHAINVLSSIQIESPASPGSYSTSATIASASRVRVWCYLPNVVGGSPGWKLVYGVF